MEVWKMEKLSSILPTSPRVQSVDLDEAPPARPGAPSLGRKEGRNSINDRVSLSPRAKEMAAQETMMGRNPKEISRAQKVEALNRRFFETRLQKPEIAPAQTAEIADRVNEAAVEEIEVPKLRESLPQYETQAPQEMKAQNLSIEA
jgi:hypothetical protein